jgi:intracellular multiplication protein IcmP
MPDNQSGNNDSSSDMIYVAGACLGLWLIVKVFFGEQILTAWLHTRMWWIHAVQLLWPWDIKSITEASYHIRTYYPAEWTSADITALSTSLRPFIWPLFAIPLAFMSWKIWRRNPGNRFRRIMTRTRLAESEVVQWPWSAPVLGINIVKESIDKGPWAMAKSPLEFARHYRLLDGTALNRLRAEKLFASQLGPLWEGVERLHRYEKALFACFIAQACRNRKGAAHGLTRLAVTMQSGNPDYSFVDDLLKQHIDDPLVQDIFQRHAYVATVMSAAVKLARRIAVLPPNYFIWLRPLNRGLWYSLNCVGRHTPFSEVSGVHAHRLAEEVSGHAIEYPYIAKTIDALDRALREVKFD